LGTRLIFTLTDFLTLDGLFGFSVTRALAKGEDEALVSSTLPG